MTHLGCDEIFPDDLYAFSAESHARCSFAYGPADTTATSYLQVLFGLPLGLEPSTSYSMHFFTHLSFFAMHAHSVATCFALVPRLCHIFLVSLTALDLELYLLHIHHFHLCLVKCHFIFFSYRPGITSMQHATSHTTAVQSLSYSQWFLHIGKQWYHLPEFIPSNLNSGLRSCVSISIHIQHVILNNKTYPGTNSRFALAPISTLCDLCWLLDSSNLYKWMTSSLWTCYLYTTAFVVYPFLTISTLYWISANTSTTDTTWPSNSLQH